MSNLFLKACVHTKTFFQSRKSIYLISDLISDNFYFMKIFVNVAKIFLKQNCWELTIQKSD